MSIGGGPEPDAFTLDRVGRGRQGRGGGTTLERRDGDAWTTVGSYPDRVAASHALDEVIAEGGSPSEYRLVTVEHHGTHRLLLIGVVVLSILVLVSLWQIIR